MSRPAPTRSGGSPSAARPPRRRRRRVLLAAAAVLVVLAGSGLLARSWIRQQYYVGAAGQEVAIFQGVPDTVAGYALSEVAERPGVRLDSLPPADRAAVLGGIPAAGLDEARTVVARLRLRVLPPCAGAPVVVTEPRPDTTPPPTPVPGVTCRAST